VFRYKDLGLRVRGLGFKVSWFSVNISGLRVYGLGFRV
jgi:hypothetical protein